MADPKVCFIFFVRHNSLLLIPAVSCWPRYCLSLCKLLDPLKKAAVGPQDRVCSSYMDVDHEHLRGDATISVPFTTRIKGVCNIFEQYLGTCMNNVLASNL
jgi:hypothetical protein